MSEGAIFQSIPKPIKRSKLRGWLGKLYYALLRYFLWIVKGKSFSREISRKREEYLYFSHKTPLLRKLRDVDMWLQYNKMNNLKLATAKIDGVVLHPGEVFSYWRLIGKPTRRKGYVEGMVLKNGGFHPGVGGGLCQLSNLIFWMSIHTPLTVIERHRHGYDVFPDSNRTQPFGSGATCFYPHGDLMIRNDTSEDYQLCVWLDEEYLYGEWRVSSPPEYRYEIVEKNHEMRNEFWGGYGRQGNRRCKVKKP